MRKHFILAAALTAMMATGAQAMLMDSSGNIVDWGLTPFSLQNQSDVQTGNTWSTISNDYSPINYPGIGHQPSPGGTTGEPYDLEEMHMRVTGSQLQVLVVTSSALSVPSSAGTLYLGDLFLTVNNERFGIVTQHANQNLAAGAVYRINGDADTVILQQQSNSYAGNNTLVDNDYGDPATIAQVSGPWAVKGGIGAGQWVGNADLSTATFNYGGREDGTFLIEYRMDLDTLGLGLLDTLDLTTKITWGCGNDVIRVHGVDTPTTPEPATLALLAAGAAMTWITRRRRR